MKRLHAVLFLVAGAASGCRPTFPLPYTTAMLAADNSGPALVHFLGQRDASPSVCDPRNRGPHITAFQEDTWDELVDGLVEGRMPPSAFAGCVDRILKGVSPRRTVGLMDRMGAAYKKLLKNADVEKVRGLRAQLDALQKLYLDRPNEVHVHHELMAKMMEELDAAMEKRLFGPVAQRYAEEIAATYNLEQGEWKGRPVTVATLDQLHGASDEKLLKRFAARLPDAGLRVEARRRLIRVRIAGSAFDEVRQNPKDVEEIVMQNGKYPISPQDFPPLSGAFNAEKLPLRGVLVRQHVHEQTITLLGYQGDKPGVSVLPSLHLRNAVNFQLKGISQPVTLCSASKDDDVTPCLPSEVVALKNPMAYLDDDGAFHFIEHASARDAVTLTKGGGEFLLPIAVAGKSLLTLRWGVWFEVPEDLAFSGDQVGGPGPDLGVGVDYRDPRRLVYSVSDGGAPLFAVVEMADALAFHVMSRGARGATGYSGEPGRPGYRGQNGSSAQCPSSPGQHGGAGSPGTHGGPGGPGGPGGRGGDVRVDVHCSAGCAQVMPILAQTVLSLGGAGGYGGAGGPGGPGGAGGSGGAGTTCYSDGSSYSLSSGSTGAYGPSGLAGPNGRPGRPGAPGHVGFRALP